MKQGTKQYQKVLIPIMVHLETQATIIAEVEDEVVEVDEQVQFQ